MAAAFRPVNSATSPASDAKMEVPQPAMAMAIATPTTPTPPRTAPQQAVVVGDGGLDDAKTPTTATFNDALASQKPLPSSPFPQAVQMPEIAEEKTPQRADSQHSRKSGDSDDVDMDDSDGETGAGDDGGASDDESVNDDGTRSNKKKKSQRFYCTDYPPCNLSFTRSEHLARHIRKHTGERPFQCHCSRRFSRLDNLRQHAQTVHVNEEIPIDSLAATGTRFQRQIRTDRVRQGAGRARAATASSTGPAGRGHSKSLSTSSITSIGSIGSSYSPRDDVRRRPPPLVMADPRSRHSLESYRSVADGPMGYRPVTPTEFSAPGSATFSTPGQNSPRWGSGVASPTSSHSRAHSMYATSGSRTPGRRLSVPSSGNPFQSPHGMSLGRTLFGPTTNGQHPGTFSPGSSILASPTASTISTWSRRDSISRVADEEWRRRTWHPDSNNFNGASRLSQVITPSQFTPPPPAPLALSENTGGPSQIRLPGIESFDPIPHRTATPPRRNPSPMMIDSEMANPPTLRPVTESASEDRRNVAVWDMGLHRGLTRLDINTPPRDSAGAWASEATQALEQARADPNVSRAGGQPTVRFEEPSQSYVPQRLSPGEMPQSQSTARVLHQHTMSAPSLNARREMKRHGWYGGPVMVHSSNGPLPDRGPHVDRIVHPNLVNGFSGFPARESEVPRAPPAEAEMARQHLPNSTDPQLRRLEALVAVATSEGSTATAY